MAGARNIAIVLALAAIVAFVPGGGTSSNVVGQALSLAFLATLAWFGAVFYRQHRVTILGLDDRIRAILYGSIAVAVLAVVGTGRLWGTGVGILVWFVLIAAASFGVVTVYRDYRRY
jgi:hypothetical protein